MSKLWNKIKIYLRPFMSWKFLVCYIIAWSWHIPLYIAIILGIIFKITWLYSICLTFYGVLWLPFCREEFFQIPIAMWLNTKIFKNDKENMEKFKRLKDEATKDWNNTKGFFKKIFKKRTKKT